MTWSACASARPRPGTRAKWTDVDRMQIKERKTEKEKMTRKFCHSSPDFIRLTIHGVHSCLLFYVWFAPRVPVTASQERPWARTPNGTDFLGPPYQVYRCLGGVRYPDVFGCLSGLMSCWVLRTISASNSEVKGQVQGLWKRPQKTL